MEKIYLDKPDIVFLREVEEKSGQTVAKCYQCGNCTAGCPMSFTFDFPVSRIMRLIQTGQRDIVLTSASISMCASCETCTERCPNSIDVAKIMDVCRHIAQSEGKFGVHAVSSFKKAFMHSIKLYGRMHEVGTMVEFMARTGRVFTDVDLAPVILPKGKMSILPHQTPGKKDVSNILKRYAEGRSDLTAASSQAVAEGKVNR